VNIIVGKDNKKLLSRQTFVGSTCSEAIIFSLQIEKSQ
jgi:hypothetical protein